MWSPKGTTLRVIRCPTLQVSQFLFPGQRSDTFLTDHVFYMCSSKAQEFSVEVNLSKVAGVNAGLNTFISRYEL